MSLHRLGPARTTVFSLIVTCSLVGACSEETAAPSEGPNATGTSDPVPSGDQNGEAPGAGGNPGGPSPVDGPSGGPAMGNAGASGGEGGAGNVSPPVSAGGAAASAGGGTSGEGGSSQGGNGDGGMSAQGGAQSQGGNGGDSAEGGSSAVGGNGVGGAGGNGAGGASAEGGNSSGGTSAGGMSSEGGSGGMETSDPRSPGCGTPVMRPDRKTQQTIDIDGTTRYYLLNVPNNADNETPLTLIFALHGYDMNNVALVDLYDFTSRSGGQAITVLPQGEGPPPGDVSHWGDQVLQSRWDGNETNYAFIEALLTEMKERYCVDETRVFITGFSMGGFFTNNIACAHNDWFRGFASVEGGAPQTCADENAKAAMMIHYGTADDIVAADSGEKNRDFWIEQNGCMDSTTASFTGCQSNDGCPEGKPVVYCVGNWNHTVSETAAANVWSFFSGLE